MRLSWHDHAWHDYFRLVHYFVRFCRHSPDTGLTELYKVEGVFSGVHKGFDGANASWVSIYNSISKRFDIESVGVINAKDITIKKLMAGMKLPPPILTRRRLSPTFRSWWTWTIGFRYVDKLLGERP